MFATSWVAPGKGDPAGYLHDRVEKSGVLGACDGGVQAKWEEKGKLSEEARKKRTGLACNACVELQAYDVERIYAAIWELDQ